MAEATIDADVRTLAPRTEPAAAARRRDPQAEAAEQFAKEESLDPQAFHFTGSGTEYFRIWVVNLLLTILTFGIYSAWAKVRRLQYFYRNTKVAGAVFDYHGSPKAILKGRVLALILVAAYKLSFDISKPVALVVVLLLVAVTPWLLSRAFRFKLANSSYRGLRFRFKGTVGQAYRMLILFPVVLALIGVFVWSLTVSFSHNPGIAMGLMIVILPILALAASLPLAHYFLKRYQYDHAYFGQSPFFFQATAKDFFKVYGKATGFFFLGAIPAGIFAFLTARLYQAMLHTMFGWLFALLYGMASAYAFYLFVRPYLESRLQNMIWNQVELGEHRFTSSVSARKLLWIHASSLFLIILTFGLYKPFATVRLIRCRVESMTLMPGSPLQDFYADLGADGAGAIGQEAGDLFDIDIAL